MSILQYRFFSWEMTVMFSVTTLTAAVTHVIKGKITIYFCWRGSRIRESAAMAIYLCHETEWQHWHCNLFPPPVAANEKRHHNYCNLFTQILSGTAMISICFRVTTQTAWFISVSFQGCNSFHRPQYYLNIAHRPMNLQYKAQLVGLSFWQDKQATSE